MIEAGSKVALLLAILVSGCGTAFVMKSMLAPSPRGAIRMDYYNEIQILAFILNVGVPVALIASGVLAGIAIRAKAFRPFPVGLVIVTLVSVFGCALAAWSGLVAAHGSSINLWSRIWWKCSS